MTAESSFTFDASTTSELEQARSLANQRRLVEAERIYRKLLESDDKQTEALRFVANAALARNEPAEAVALLSRAAAIDRDNIGVLLDLGAAYRMGDRRDEAGYVFRRALELSEGKNTTARLMLAHVLELDNRPDMALLQYFRAIVDAQGKGKWLSDETTEPGLQRMVRHAMDYVARERRAWFDTALASHRTQNAEGMMRIEAGLAIYLRERPFQPRDIRQQVSFLYLPGLPTQSVVDPSAIDGLSAFAAGIGEFDEIIENCLAISPEPEVPAFTLDALTSKSDSISPKAMRTRFFPLCQRGTSSLLARHHSGALLTAMQQLPLMRIEGFGENISLFEVAPGGKQPIQYGRSNAILHAYVACATSPPAKIVVGGEPHIIKPCQALVCDPSFGVAIENTHGTNARLISMDVWHPDLAPFERDALSTLIGAVLEFDGRLQDLDQAVS